MPSPSYSTRGDALKSLALRLHAAVVPYYLHTPRGKAEPAPGWYWQPAGVEHPVYLAHNHLDAYAHLRGLLDDQERQRGASAA